MLIYFIFRVLGKFGGGNRKMMIEPQKLEYVSTEFDPPAILARFNDQEHEIEFPVSKVSCKINVLFSIILIFFF